MIFVHGLNHHLLAFPMGGQHVQGDDILQPVIIDIAHIIAHAKVA